MFKRAICGLPIAVLFVSLHAGAATYYVRNGGDDSADGKTHESAWASISKVNSYKFASGDVVLFHEGDTWKSQQLWVDWGGTSSAKAVIGSYYVDGGTPVRGFRTSRPTIDGQDRFPGLYDALIEVRAPHVRVENFALINSKGRGIAAEDSNHFQAVGLRVDKTYDCAIVLIDSDDGLVENNHVSESDRRKLMGDNLWCSSISMVRADRTVVRRNVVEHGYGEGINANYGSSDVLIEDNRVFGVRAVGIYADSAPNVTIRRNMVVGTADKQYWRYKTSVGPGIAVCNEPYSHVEGGGRLDNSVQTRNARVYNNLVAYTVYGIAFWGALSNSSFDNTLVYNNTFVDNTVQFSTLGSPMPGSLLANNIFLSLSDGAQDVSGTASGLKTRNNYYSQGDPGGIYSHSGNKYSGVQLAKMSGWQSIKASGDVKPGDFVPSRVSTTIGAGDESPLAAAKSQDGYRLDFNGNPHNTPIDLGAIRHGDSGIKKPKSPKFVGARNGK